MARLRPPRAVTTITTYLMDEKKTSSWADLIKEISESFITDIDTFVNKHFHPDTIEESLFFLREEIKALQTIAKALTLNTRSFTHTQTLWSE